MTGCKDDSPVTPEALPTNKMSADNLKQDPIMTSLAEFVRGRSETLAKRGRFSRALKILSHKSSEKGWTVEQYRDYINANPMLNLTTKTIALNTSRDTQPSVLSIPTVTALLFINTSIRRVEENGQSYLVEDVSWGASTISSIRTAYLDVYGELEWDYFGLITVTESDYAQTYNGTFAGFSYVSVYQPANFKAESNHYWTYFDGIRFYDGQANLFGFPPGQSKRW
jgi:hypothetical protein